MVPSSLFCANSSTLRDKSDCSGGMLPSSSLVGILRKVSAERFPSEVGSVPEN